MSEATVPTKGKVSKWHKVCAPLFVGVGSLLLFALFIIANQVVKITPPRMRAKSDLSGSLQDMSA